MSKPVIEIENLGKLYRLGQVGTGTLASDLHRWWAKVRGKEDPTLKLGDINDRTEKGQSEYVWALKDINLSISQGDVLGIIGKNGSGKSTLLKILSRTTSPTLGSFRIKGKVASLLEVGTGFHPDLSGRENVFLNGSILGMTKKEISRNFDEIVAFSGVEKYIDTPVKRYSSGMYVRLAFAVAAHLNPEILIVDEVLAVGDAEFQAKCLGKMKDVSGQGRTILFVSHNMDAIERLCNKCVYLQNGRLIDSGETYKITSLYLNKTNNYVYNLNQSTANIGAKITSVILRNSEDGDTQNIFHYQEKIKVIIDYTIYTPIKNAIVWLDIRKDGKVIFASSDCDMNITLYRNREPGTYCAELYIDRNFLNMGVHDLVFGINGYSPLVDYDRIENITLKIIDEKNYENFEFIDRIGFVKPLLKWHYK